MATILLVEDDAAIGQALREALASEGYTVRFAADGEQALAQLRNGLDPDLIVLDLMLPNMSGQQFRVRQVVDPMLRDIPVIVLSAVPLVDDIAKALQAHASLSKPVRLEELLDTIERVLQR